MKDFICDYCGAKEEDRSSSRNKRFCNVNCRVNWHLKNNPKYKAYQKSYKRTAKLKVIAEKKLPIARRESNIWTMRRRFLKEVLGE